MAAFHFADEAEAHSNVSMQEAEADFAAVLAGCSPTHAQVIKDAPLPADGGTRFYQGNGYRLTVVKMLVQAGGVSGFVYGPLLVFDSGVMSGNGNKIESTSFYSSSAMGRLLDKQ
jgi:hypothetical protein